MWSEEGISETNKSDCKMCARVVVYLKGVDYIIDASFGSFEFLTR